MHHNKQLQYKLRLAYNKVFKVWKTLCLGVLDIVYHAVFTQTDTDNVPMSVAMDLSGTSPASVIWSLQMHASLLMAVRMFCNVK